LSPNEARLPSLRDAFLMVFFGFSLALIAQLLGFPFLGKWNLFVSGIMMGVPAVVFCAVKRLPFQDVFRLKPVDLRLLAAGALIGLGMAPASDEMDRLVQKIIPMSPDILKALEDLMRAKSIRELTILAAALCVIAPLGEEMLFRGVLQGTLERNGNVNKAVFSTALIFTAIHFNPWWTMEILVMGVFLGVIAWKTKSIYPCIAVHAVNNTLSLALLNVPMQRLRGYEFKGHVSPVWIVFGVMLVYLAFKWIYRITDKKSEAV
jgi:membrane protease YdiL (CAAX protease family)